LPAYCSPFTNYHLNLFNDTNEPNEQNELNVKKKKPNLLRNRDGKPRVLIDSRVTLITGNLAVLF
jgi:hypothetical protein